MPELPEVEGYTRYFAKHALGKRIANVDVRDERILGEIRKDAFVRRLEGRTFDEVRRHGKHLFARVAPAGVVQASRPASRSRRPEAGLEARTTPPTPWLHLHFGMTGDLASYRDDAGAPRFAKIVFTFDDGSHLAFEDMRLFGLAELIDSPDPFIAERGLGPDPLDPSFSYARFAALLEGRRGALKSLLMSQEIVAGLGNLYVDEILFQTSIHPRRAVDRLKETEKRALFTTMRKVLRDVIQRHERGKGWSSRWLTANREVDGPCTRCGGTLRRTVVFGRTTYFCAKHQR